MTKKKRELPYIFEAMPEQTEIVAEKILRTAKFERTVEVLDHDFGQNWKNFKSAWLNEEYSC